MPAAASIEVKGLRELQRAARAAGKETRAAVRKALAESGAPVREQAEHLASTDVRAGARWSRMKIGVTARSVYVAPAGRRSGGSPRPNFGRLLMTRAMLPAVEQKQDEVVARFEDAVDQIADAFKWRAP